MKQAVLAALVLVAAGMTGLAQEEHDKYSLGLKVWSVSPEIGDETLMYGPTFSMDLPDDQWLSTMVTFGIFEYRWASETEVDAELVYGKSFPLVDVGVGLRYFSFTFDFGSGDRDQSSNYGLMLYLGAGQPFGDSPFGWYAGVSWVPIAWGDEEGEHINYELGLSAFWEGWNATLGYRARDMDTTGGGINGIAASVGMTF